MTKTTYFVNVLFCTLVVSLSIWNIWTGQSLEENDAINADDILRIENSTQKVVLTSKQEVPSGNVESTPEKQPNHDRVHFIPISKLELMDSFSATWWQSKERFMRIFPPEKIVNPDGAVFRFTEVLKMSELRMTSDWLQFSVEYMSKVWKIAGFQSQQESLAYHMFVDKFLNYTTRALNSQHLTNNVEDNSCSKTDSSTGCSYSNAMRQTIALIAFMPYKSRVAETRGQTITTANLVATLTSLIRVSCGRIVIVVDQKDFNDPRTPAILIASKQVLLNSSLRERNSIEELFLDSSLARQSQEMMLRQDLFEFRIFSSEIALAIVSCSAADGTLGTRSRFLPKAALLGLYRAFLQSHPTHDPVWFGKRGASYWNFTYLTEPDTILQAKLGALSALSRELRHGKIIAPHRIQPIPHAHDLPNYSGLEYRVVPSNGTFANKIIALDANLDHACCDAGLGRPGAYLPNDRRCGWSWWTCGFWTKTGRIEDHARLAHYQFMELQQGTQIVTLASNEHGRQCVPQTNNGGQVCGNETL